MEKKKFENAFTSAEQSQRLLKLGIPANTADCSYVSELDKQVYVNARPFDELKAMEGNSRMVPCWTATRLWEIYYICQCYDDYESYSHGDTIVEQAINKIEEAISDDMFDFLNLENYEQENTEYVHNE